MPHKEKSVMKKYLIKIVNENLKVREEIIEGDSFEADEQGTLVIRASAPGQNYRKIAAYTKGVWKSIKEI